MNLRQSLETALRELEAQFPQFRSANYQPCAGEAEAYRQYKLLERRAEQETTAEAFSLFQRGAEKDRAEASEILARMGLEPPPDLLSSPVSSPTANAAAASAAPAATRAPQKRTPSKNVDPETAKRRALVKSNPDASAKELCEIFDRERVPLPPKWKDGGYTSWTKAYRDPHYRRRTDVLVSKDRKYG